MIQIRSSDSYLDKSNILSQITEYDIFRYYCLSFKDIGIKFCSELRKDVTPTCSIVPYNNKLLYKDFGNGESHDCFSYVQKKYGLTFIEALRVIDNDFGLGLQAGTIHKSQIALTYGNQKVEDRKPTVIKKKGRNWNADDDKFWMQFGITRRLLTIFEVQPIEYFWINEFRYKCEKLAYAYCFDGRYKIYQPLSPKETKWFSNTRKEDIQGYKQLDPFGYMVILASSLKDVMTLEVLGYQAVALQGEMQTPPPKLIEHFKSRFDLVAVLYDNDYTNPENPGQTMANKICATYNLLNIVIPTHYQSKDISDLVRDHGLECAKRIVKIQIP